VGKHTELEGAAYAVQQAVERLKGKTGRDDERRLTHSVFIVQVSKSSATAFVQAD
jgi:hypothetical protein